MPSNPAVLKWSLMGEPIPSGVDIKHIKHIKHMYRILTMSKRVLEYRINNVLDVIEIFPGLPEMYRIMVSVLGREETNKYMKTLAIRYRLSPRTAIPKTMRALATALPEPQRTQFLKAVKANHY